MESHLAGVRTRGGSMTCVRLVAAALVVVLAAAGVAAGAEWDVYPGGSIQDAIDGAGPGDTIYVHDGAYVENVCVDKRVTLIGDGADVVTVLAADAKDHVFEVTADWVNISGFAVSGTTGYWTGVIRLNNADHCNISENNCSNNRYGIFLHSSSYNTLINNTANSNIVDGISLYHSSNYNALTENNCSNNRCGICIDSSSYNTLTNHNANSNDNEGIYLSSSGNNRLTGNNVSNNGVGISLGGSSNNKLTNNTANSNNYNGIYLSSSSHNTITENNCCSNKGDGIHLYSSNNYNTLSENNCLNNGNGIFLYSSSHNILTSNTASNNWYGIWLYAYSSSNNTLTDNIFINNGFFVEFSYHNTVENNTVNGKPLVYLEDTRDYTIANAGQVVLVNCNNITAENLNLANASVGIELWGTDNSTISNNNCSNNGYGIRLDYSSNYNKVTNNTANSNSMDGIFLYTSSNYNILTSNTASNNYYGISLSSSSDNTLTNNNCSNSDDGIHICYSSNCNTLIGNTVSGNDHGIYLLSSRNNLIHHNNALNNVQNAYDHCTNQWNSTTTGNYWDDYTGTDNNTDGIGDNPYPIPGGSSVDRYPLMVPWSDTPQKGDLNSNGILTPADAAITLEIAVGSRPCNATMFAVADVSEDNRVTSLDALMIMQAAAGAISL
ncbi:MAG: hypothetical protein C4B59_05520 [Candidatus Methanogaster sp.]|uniref:Uncharacterized protein n=1 Tax=Candidatus Methanogaster sp. TaxID=3386292 RepID=A0AC61L4K3_9EURY|nr:MAG: hypothetical protein C4B59_05520 [ANME-2 cluster archaeon]